MPARGAKVVIIPLATLLHVDSKDRKGAVPEPQPTDFSGYYIFPSVSPGVYLINVEQSGYADDLKLIRTVLERFTTDERLKLLSTFPQVTITAGGTLRKEVVMHRAASIAGHVSVDLGGTIPNSYVTATLVSSTLVGNVEASGHEDPGFSLKAIVDDRGAFRITGLPSGRYRLSTLLAESYLSISQLPDKRFEMRALRPGNGRVTVYASQALTKEKATLFEVRDGDEITDADFMIPMSRFHSISGVIAQDGVPIPSAAVHIEQEGTSWDHIDAISGLDGSFRLDFVSSGTYSLVGKVYPASEVTRAKDAHRTVVVADADVFDVDLELHNAGEQ